MDYWVTTQAAFDIKINFLFHALDYSYEQIHISWVFYFDTTTPSKCFNLQKIINSFDIMALIYEYILFVKRHQ